MPAATDIELEEFLTQKACWWAYSGPDTTGMGQTFAEPEEISCRWTDAEEQITTEQGTTLKVTTYVMVDRDVKEGDVLWFGRIAAANLTDPFANAGAQRIQRTAKIPNIDGDGYVRKAWL